jgi:hypothetical protein
MNNDPQLESLVRNRTMYSEYEFQYERFSATVLVQVSQNQQQPGHVLKGATCTVVYVLFK